MTWFRKSSTTSGNNKQTRTHAGSGQTSYSTSSGGGGASGSIRTTYTTKPGGRKVQKITRRKADGSFSIKSRTIVGRKPSPQRKAKASTKMKKVSQAAQKRQQASAAARVRSNNRRAEAAFKAQRDASEKRQRAQDRAVAAEKRANAAARDREKKMKATLENKVAVWEEKTTAKIEKLLQKEILPKIEQYMDAVDNKLKRVESNIQNTDDPEKYDVSNAGDLLNELQWCATTATNLPGFIMKFENELVVKEKIVYKEFSETAKVDLTDELKQFRDPIQDAYVSIIELSTAVALPLIVAIAYQEDVYAAKDLFEEINDMFNDVEKMTKQRSFLGFFENEGAKAVKSYKSEAETVLKELEELEDEADADNAAEVEAEVAGALKDLKNDSNLKTINSRVEKHKRAIEKIDNWLYENGGKTKGMMNQVFKIVKWIGWISIIGSPIMLLKWLHSKYKEWKKDYSSYHKSVNDLITLATQKEVKFKTEMPADQHAYYDLYVAWLKAIVENLDNQGKVLNTNLKNFSQYAEQVGDQVGNTLVEEVKQTIDNELKEDPMEMYVRAISNQKPNSFLT